MAESSISHKCEVQNCPNPGKFRCTSCQTVYYCSQDHQRSDWLANHKAICAKAKSSTPATNPDNSKSCNSESEIRTCRCMFCGQALLLSSEDEATDHMRVCTALQEQLASKDQFTVPTEVKQKMEKQGKL
jgi:hypothetical protein